MKKFEDLGLKKDIVFALKRNRFVTATAVQEKIIPLTQQGKNVVFTSQTGSGKTLAYTLGFLSKINPKNELQMAVIVPTRELCIQVGKNIKQVCELLNINVGVVYGGREIVGDYKTLRTKNQILVGTPGRFIEHINEKRIKVGEVRCLVFDESDQMFDNGFSKDCRYIKERVSKTSQIILASATITEKVEEFINQEIDNHVLLAIGDEIPVGIIQEKLYCEKIEKNDLLIKLFNQKKFKRAIVFCNTKQKSSGISEYLENCGINSKSISSTLEQDERKQVLDLFKEGKIKVLVATDVASRGLHIEQVDIVVNYDVPTRDEFYVHRIGRTGRNDKMGYAITFICPEDIDRFDNIEFDYELKVDNVDHDFKDSDVEPKREAPETLDDEDIEEHEPLDNMYD